MMNRKQQKLCLAALAQVMREGHHVCAFLCHTPESTYENAEFILCWNGGYTHALEDLEMQLREQLPFPIQDKPRKTEISQ